MYAIVLVWIGLIVLGELSAVYAVDCSQFGPGCSCACGDCGSNGAGLGCSYSLPPSADLPDCCETYGCIDAWWRATPYISCSTDNDCGKGWRCIGGWCHYFQICAYKGCRCYSPGGGGCSPTKPGKPSFQKIVSVFNTSGGWVEDGNASNGTGAGSSHHNRNVKLYWSGVDDWGKNCGRGSHHFEVQIRESASNGESYEYIVPWIETIAGQELFEEQSGNTVFYRYNHECKGILSNPPGIDCTPYCYYDTTQNTLRRNHRIEENEDNIYCVGEECSTSELKICSPEVSTDDEGNQTATCKTPDGEVCATYFAYHDEQTGWECRPNKVPANYCTDRCVYSGGHILPKDDGPGDDATDNCPDVPGFGESLIPQPMVIIPIYAKDMGLDKFAQGGYFEFEIQVKRPQNSALYEIEMDVLQARQNDDGTIDWLDVPTDNPETSQPEPIEYARYAFSGDMEIKIDGIVRGDDVNVLVVRIGIPQDQPWNLLDNDVLEPEFGLVFDNSSSPKFKYYAPEQSPGNWRTACNPGDNTSCIIQNLKWGTTYDVRIRAHNGAEAGEWNEIYNAFKTNVAPTIGSVLVDGKALSSVSNNNWFKKGIHTITLKITDPDNFSRYGHPDLSLIGIAITYPDEYLPNPPNVSESEPESLTLCVEEARHFIAKQRRGPF